MNVGPAPRLAELVRGLGRRRTALLIGQRHAQPAQRPAIVWVALEVLAEHRLGIRRALCSKQFGPEQRAHRKDDVARLVVGELILERDGLGEQRNRFVAVSLGARQTRLRLQLADGVQRPG